MNYLKIRLIFNSAKESYENGDISAQQYLKIIDDLENDIIKVDRYKTEASIKALINAYVKI